MRKKENSKNVHEEEDEDEEDVYEEIKVYLKFRKQVLLELVQQVPLNQEQKQNQSQLLNKLIRQQITLNQDHGLSLGPDIVSFVRIGPTSF